MVSVRSQIAAVRWMPMQLRIMLMCAWSKFILGLY